MATLQVIDRDGVSHDVECKPGLKVMEVLRELDYGVAATELNGYNIALQSTYKAYAKVSNLSLFNVL